MGLYGEGCAVGGFVCWATFIGKCTCVYEIAAVLHSVPFPLLRSGRRIEHCIYRYAENRVSSIYSDMTALAFVSITRTFSHLSLSLSLSHIYESNNQLVVDLGYQSM